VQIPEVVEVRASSAGAHTQKQYVRDRIHRNSQTTFVSVLRKNISKKDSRCYINTGKITSGLHVQKIIRELEICKNQIQNTEHVF
jgi:hypothetical protein